MVDFFTGRTLEDLEKGIDTFVKICNKKLVRFKRSPMPTFKDGIYYLDVEYELRDHQIMKSLR